MHRTLVLVVSLLASFAAQALEIHVMQPWSRATPPGVDTAVGYLILHNGGSKPAKLVAVSSPRAASVELHESRVTNGMSEMRPVTELVVPAGGMVRFEPNGKHLMLVGLKAPLQAGEHVPLSLTFEGEAPLQAELVVRPLGTVAAPDDHHEHEHHAD